MDLPSVLINSILFILPSYFANSIPVVLGGGAPLDGKRKLSNGQRIFGDGKTVRGFFSGIFAGILVGVLEGMLLAGTEWGIYSGAFT